MVDTDHALAIVPDDREVQSLASRVVPQWSNDVNKEQAIELARLALAYGLDPFLGELIPYQGKPYLTFDGRIRLADQHPAYDGYEHGPVLGDERDAFIPQRGEVIWKCVVYRRDRSRPTVAYGRAGGENERNPVAKKDPATMAQKRAIHRALRAAFPVRMPGVVDDDPVTPAQLKAIHAADNEHGVTVTERHEVLEATFGVSSSKDLTAAQAGSYLDERAVQKPREDDPQAEFADFLGSKKPNHYKLTHEQLTKIYELRDKLGIDRTEFDQEIAKRNDGRPPQGLTMTQADALIASLKKLLAARAPDPEPEPEPEPPAQADDDFEDLGEF